MRIRLAKRQLLILRLVQWGAGNSRYLRKCLAEFGVDLTAAELRNELRSLEDRGLIACEKHPNATIMHLMSAGRRAVLHLTKDLPCETDSGASRLSPRLWFAVMLKTGWSVYRFRSPEAFCRAADLGCRRYFEFVEGRAEPTLAELRYIRRALNVNLDYLVAAVGLLLDRPNEPCVQYKAHPTPRRIAQLENGEVQPTLDELVALRQTLGFTIDWFVAGIEPARWGGGEEVIRSRTAA